MALFQAFANCTTTVDSMRKSDFWESVYNEWLHLLATNFNEDPQPGRCANSLQNKYKSFNPEAVFFHGCLAKTCYDKPGEGASGFTEEENKKNALVQANDLYKTTRDYTKQTKGLTEAEIKAYFIYRETAKFKEATKARKATPVKKVLVKTEVADGQIVLDMEGASEVEEQKPVGVKKEKEVKKHEMEKKNISVAIYESNKIQQESLSIKKEELEEQKKVNETIVAESIAKRELAVAMKKQLESEGQKSLDTLMQDDAEYMEDRKAMIRAQMKKKRIEAEEEAAKAEQKHKEKFNENISD